MRYGAGKTALLVTSALSFAAAAITGAAHAADVDPATARPARSAPRVSAAAAKAPAAQPPTFRVTTAPVRIDPILLTAYAALNAGDLAKAAADYAQILKSDADNPEALHGAAVAALRADHRADAEYFYLRAVNADPGDAIAVAGLAGLRGHADPADAESRLKSLIAEQPWQHVLHFALGNVYAGTGRWSEAERAYFRAHDAAAEHPDYLFNLAVSLEHLRQPRLAAQYYELAIAAAAKRPAFFDAERTAARLPGLQR